MNQYETVNNPYETQMGGQYPNQGQGYPTGQAYPPSQQGQGYPQQNLPPQQPQSQQGGYPPSQQGQGYPPPQQQTPPPVPAAPQQNGGGGGGQQQYERKQFVELRTQSGNPLEQLNLVMMTGYFHHMRDAQGNPKYTESGNSVRLGFSLAEKQTWTDNNGQTQTRVVWHRCQAWSDFARTLVQVHDGTPIKIWGNLTQYYLRDQNNAITGTLVDIKVNKFEFP